MSGRLLAWSAAAVLTVCGSMQHRVEAQSTSIQTQEERRNFDIPAQSLTSALLQFSDVTGIQLFFDANLARGLQSPGARGTMSRSEALARLVAGSGLTYRFTNPQTVTLEKLPAANGTGMALPPVQVEAPRETATGPIQGYVAHQSATATKTGTSLLETPQAVSVVGRDQMQAQNAHGLVDALRYTPGVQGGTDPVENRFDSLLIRGFQPTYYLDGMQLPFGANQFGRTMVDPFGLERVEVLRGPSSALYGQIPPGGMVNMVSLRPPSTPVHMVDIQGNNFGQLQGGFDLGGPVNQDGTLMYRLTGLVHGGGTQIDHVDDRRIMIAPAFTWQPDADTRFTFLSQFQQDRSGTEIQFLPTQGTLRFNPHGLVPVGTFVGEPNDDSYRRTQYWVGYQFEHRFNDTWTVRQNLRYANVDTNLFAIIGNGLQANLSTLNRLAYHVPESAQDVTLDNQAETHFDTGPLTHTLLAGLDYRWTSSRYQFGTGPAPTLTLFAPVYDAVVNVPKSTVITGQEQDQIGIYAQDQIALDKWRLTLSARHDWVDTETDNFIANTHQDQDDSAMSGRVGLNYVFDFGLSPYVSWAHSFQPTVGTSVGGAPFSPTTGDGYEVGVKYQPPGTNVSVDAAAFTLTQNNSLVADPLHPGFSVQTGEIRARGFELGGTASLADGLNVVGSYTYTDATTISGTATTTGKQPINVPRHEVGMWADYSIPEGRLAGFGFGGGVRYFGAVFGDAANTLRIPGYTLVDATLHYDLGSLQSNLRGAQLALNANNLLNARYVSTCTSVSACYFGTARLVTVDLRYSW